MLPRVLALVLDGIAVSFVYALVEVVVWVVGAWRGEPAVFEPAPQGVTFTTVNLVYFAWCWTGGGSLGQRALRMYTLNASDASLLSWNQALLRWLYLYGPVALVNVFFKASAVGTTMYIAAVLFGWAYWLFLLWTAARDPKHQGFHDVQAHTVVANVISPS
jgi:hypothetical protein